MDNLWTTGVHDYAETPMNPHVRADHPIAWFTAPTSWSDNQIRSRTGLVRNAEVGSSSLRLLLLDPAAAPELQLAELTRHTDGIAFRRDRFGVVRVYGSGGGLRHVGRRWETSPSLADAFAKVHRSAPMVGWSVLADILRFAYFVLSPWYIGATLVWVLSSADPFTQMGVDLQPLRLSVAPTGAEPSIAFAAHLLAQFDGATILAPDGRILRTGVQLSASERAKEFIAPLLMSSADVRLGVLFGVCQADRSESLLQPLEAIALTRKQRVEHRVRERLESVRMAVGASAQRVPDVRQILIVQALESHIRHVNYVWPQPCQSTGSRQVLSPCAIAF